MYSQFEIHFIEISFINVPQHFDMLPSSPDISIANNQYAVQELSIGCRGCAMQKFVDELESQLDVLIGPVALIDCYWPSLARDT